MKKKIFKCLNHSINSFDEISSVEFIGLFGSFISSKSDFGDVDILIIAKKRVVSNFLTHLSRVFDDSGLNMVVFHSIVEKPNKSEDSVLIHTLNYPSLNSLLKNEWKPLLNYFRSNLKVLYGSKDFPNKIPYFKLSKKQLFKDVLKWLKSIDSEADFIDFKNYFIKLTPIWLSSYSYLDLSFLNLINSLFEENIFWKDQLTKTILLLD